MPENDDILFGREGDVATVTLNRPQALNALNSPMMDELSAVLDGFEADDAIRCVIITGSEKAFAAGADITEMRFHAGFNPPAARPDASPIPPGRARTGPLSAP